MQARGKRGLSAVTAGKGLSVLFTFLLLVYGVLDIVHPPDLVCKTMAVGWPLWVGTLDGGGALVIALLYALPRTPLLDAILVVEYLGGAIAAHLRVGELGSRPQVVRIIAPAVAWSPLWLREPTLQKLLPLTLPQMRR